MNSSKPGTTPPQLIMPLLILALTLGFIACNRASIGACSNGTDLAVYHQLQKTLRGYNSLNAWIEKPPKDVLDKEQREIDRIRAWLKTAQLHPCVRSEYNQWLDYYYQNGLDEAYKEIREHGEAREMEQFEADGRRDEENARQLINGGKIPAPPSTGNSR